MTARFDNGVQILDVTDPASPVALSSAVNGVGGYTGLEGAYNVDIFTVGDGRTYALVAGQGPPPTAYSDTAGHSHGGDELQVIDITDPSNPSHVTTSSSLEDLHGASEHDRSFVAADNKRYVFLSIGEAASATGILPTHSVQLACCL